MSINCMNCGAMLIGGETVCPVCRQPVTPAKGAVNWQQPAPQPVTPWQQPMGQPSYVAPPGAGGSSMGLKAVWIGLIAFLLLVVLGAGGFFIYMKNRDAAIKGANGNRNARERAEYTPDANDADATPTPATSRTSNNSRAPISGGILNGKATSLPKPVYPATARVARASGTVVVQVTVDESGRVTEARAVSGHPLLQASAVAAARAARFSPTLLSGKPVKVRGLITYNFAPE